MSGSTRLPWAVNSCRKASSRRASSGAGFGASPPRGLVAGSYITVALKGSGHRDWLYFYVFDTARQAQAFYAGLEPPEGYRSTGLIDSSGFSQPTSCRTYSNSSPTSPSSSYFSGCALHWGNVVVYTEAGLTQSVTPDENALAVTLARTAVIELDRLDSN